MHLTGEHFGIISTKCKTLTLGELPNLEVLAIFDIVLMNMVGRINPLFEN